MKTIRYTTLLIAAAIVISACKKDYLVQNPPTSIPVANAITTVNDLGDAVNGMYHAMTPDSLFGRDIPVLGDLMSDNCYISIVNSGRYLAENNFSFISNNSEALDIYGKGYFVILQANRIIAAQIPPGNASDVSQLKGEAYIVRALCYLQLVNFFGEPYTVAPTDMGVPVITTPTNPSNPYLKPARATVAAVYKQIISDLDSAYAIMPDGGTSLHPINSEYLSKYAAKAIESRAYLYEGDYTDAQAAALLVVNGGGYSLTPSNNLVAYWANPAPVADKTETIFELAQTETENDGFDALASIYSQGSSGYGDMLVTPELYSTYSSTDARQQLIIPGQRGGFNVWVNNKYSNSANQTDKDDIKIIRYAEVLLTLAESYNRNGDDADAKKYLNQLVEMRDPSFKGYTDTGAALLADIINERRKELAFEGLRYFDLTRLNVPIVRPQEQDSAPSIGLIPVGDYRRLLPIPKAEVDANPNTKQNPGYLN
jgi:tetratricopeptide (TPR) repeat protein